MSDRKKRRRRWPWIVLACVLLAFAAFWLLGLWISPPNGGREYSELAGLPFPTVIAHRGASYHAPESTRPAYLLARHIGAHYLECDVRRTRDGQLVVFHDDELAEKTNADVEYPGREAERIEDFTLEELRRLDVGHWFNTEPPDRARESYVGQRILTLDELIDLAEAGENKPGLYIETKTPKRYPGIEQDLVQLLTRRGWLEDGNPVVTTAPNVDSRVRVGLGKARIVFQSFSEASLRRLAEAAPGVPRVLLIYDETVEEDGWDAVLERAGHLGVVGIGPSGLKALWWNTGPAHDAELIVHPYTINKSWEMTLLRQAGVDGFFTDRPELGLTVTGHAGRVDVDALLQSLGY